MTSPMRTISLPTGDQIPVLGQGTWGLGESRARRSSEIAALRRGLDLGMNLIDTSEMYANGDAEILVGEAIAGRREEVFLVTKVWPHHATREGTVQACQGSLRGLNTGWIDLYLLHWRGPVPLARRPGRGVPAAAARPAAGSALGGRPESTVSQSGDVDGSAAGTALHRPHCRVLPPRSAP